MKEKLAVLIDSIINGNEENAKIAFKEYSTAKTKEIVYEQMSLFSDHDSKPMKKFVVIPMGVSFDDFEHARSVADNNYEKKAKVLDTESEMVVYIGKKVS